MSDSLAEAGVLRVVVAGTDLVVWRGADGKVRAWENRCPHRGMRLSYGFVRGNRLTCLYHGWGYDGDGSCVSIPAHPSLTPPKSIKVTRYACAEAAGLVWIAQEGANDPVHDPGGRWRSVQTIDIDLRLEDARSAIAAASLDDDAAPNETRTSSEQASEATPRLQASEVPDRERAIVVLDDPRRGRKVLCALQPVSDTRTALHLLVSDGEDNTAARRACAQWGRRLRRRYLTVPGGARSPSASIGLDPVSPSA